MVAQTSGGGGASLLISLLLMIAIFYFLLIRPQQRRMRQQRALIESIQVGDEILTIGGIFGTIRSVDDEAVSLEIAPATTVRVLKSAIARRLVDEVAPAEGEEAGGIS